MTLPGQLRRGHAPGDVLDPLGRLFATIHPGQGEAPCRPGLAALADAVVDRWNLHLSLTVRCDLLEKRLKAETAHRMRAEADRDEALAALAAALRAQGDLKQLIGQEEA